MRELVHYAPKANGHPLVFVEKEWNLKKIGNARIVGEISSESLEKLISLDDLLISKY